ncbi:TRAP transporter small permease subunit [Rhodospirillum sp. A1_3_36]|uniref:TRAP transporter small permease subunit n=1 Tax=Rhodospirillum sp. A1_3_36 TaxID=3391666 RepID=UPI0039A70DC9
MMDGTPDHIDSAANTPAPPTVPARAVPEAGLLGRLINAGGNVFAVGIILSALVLLTEVFLRYVFNSPTIWAHETTTFLCALAFLYGGLFCAARDSHVRVVLIYGMLSPRVRGVFNIVISALSCLAAGCFSYAAFFMVEKAIFAPSGEVRLETSGSAWDPPIPALVKIFLLCMLILLTAQFLVLTVNYGRRFLKGEHE